MNSPYNNIALPANSNNDVKRIKTAINTTMSHCLGCLKIQQIRICKEGDIGFCGIGKFFCVISVIILILKYGMLEFAEPSGCFSGFWTALRLSYKFSNIFRACKSFQLKISTGTYLSWQQKTEIPFVAIWKGLPSYFLSIISQHTMDVTYFDYNAYIKNYLT